MNKLIGTATLLLIAPVWASSQNADHPHFIQGYGFVAGETTGDFSGGAGVEGISSHGIGFGGEYAYRKIQWENQLSLNLFYHFGASTAKRRFEPFVTGGFTRLWKFNLGLTPAWGGNLGCGANIWVTKHVGVRLEARDTIGGRSLSIQYPSLTYSEPNNVGSFRIGVTFR
jgi:hypothetical protein